MSLAGSLVWQTGAGQGVQRAGERGRRRAAAAALSATLVRSPAVLHWAGVLSREAMGWVGGGHADWISSLEGHLGLLLWRVSAPRLHRAGDLAVAIPGGIHQSTVRPAALPPCRSPEAWPLC